MSDIWCVNGKTWYSKRVIDKIVDKCRKYCRPLKEGKEMGTVAYMENGKVVCKVEPVVWQEMPLDNSLSLANEILELLEVESVD